MNTTGAERHATHLPQVGYALLPALEISSAQTAHSVALVKTERAAAAAVVAMESVEVGLAIATKGSVVPAVSLLVLEVVQTYSYVADTVHAIA